MNDLNQIANASQPGSVTEARTSTGYPLAALFVLVAVCAILLGLLTPVVRQASNGEMDWQLLIGCTITAAFLCGIMGAIAGLFARPWYVGMPICGVVGLLVGAVCGPLLLLNAASLPAVIIATFGGAFVIVAIGVIVRLSAREADDTVTS